MQAARRHSLLLVKLWVFLAGRRNPVYSAADGEVTAERWGWWEPCSRAVPAGAVRWTTEGEELAVNIPGVCKALTRPSVGFMSVGFASPPSMVATIIIHPNVKCCILKLQENCRTSIESSHWPFPQLPLLLIIYVTVVQVSVPVPQINAGAILSTKLQTLFKVYQFSHSWPSSVPKFYPETLRLDVFSLSLLQSVTISLSSLFFHGFDSCDKEQSVVLKNVFPFELVWCFLV